MVLQRIKEILRNKRGEAVLLTMGLVLLFALIASIVFFFSITSIRITNIRKISQNSIDVYTIKTGKEIMKSIKSGHDYTALLNEERFLSELQAQLRTRTRYNGHDSQNGNLVYEIKDLKVDFIQDKTLKTTTSYTIVYHCYFMSKHVYVQDFHVKQESSYNLKY